MMKRRIMNEKTIEKFKEHLIKEEKSMATVEKYLRDVKAFYCYASDKELIKETVVYALDNIKARCRIGGDYITVFMLYCMLCIIEIKNKLI